MANTQNSLTDDQKKLLESLVGTIREAAQKTESAVEQATLMLRFIADASSFLTLVLINPDPQLTSSQWKSGDLLPTCWKQIQKFSRYVSERPLLLRELLVALQTDIAKVTDAQYLEDRKRHPLMIGTEVYSAGNIPVQLAQIGTTYLGLKHRGAAVLSKIGPNLPNFTEFIPFTPKEGDGKNWHCALAFSTEDAIILIMVPWEYAHMLKKDKDKPPELIRPFGVYTKGSVKPETVTTVLTTFAEAL